MHSRALAAHSHHLIFTLLSFLRATGCKIFRKPAANQTWHRHWPITSQQLPFFYIGDKSSLWEDTETSTVTQQGPCLSVDLSWIKQYRVRQKKKLVIYSAFWLFNLGQKSWDHLQYSKLRNLWQLLQLFLHLFNQNQNWDPLCLC